jgi:hypothetical protein
MTMPRFWWPVALVLFASYAYFYQAGGWNQNSRFALVRAVLERHTLRIDAYHEQTGDRAMWKGHYYSDKAPGASFVALVPVAIMRAASAIVGMDPTSDDGIAWTSYAATVTASGLFTLAAALCVGWLSLTWGFSRAAALFAAMAYGVASPAWAYATLFMGHALSAGCLMIAFASTVALGHADDARVRSLAWVVGGSSGWAVVSEFPAAVPVVFIMALALLTTRDRGTHTLRAVIVRIIAGGAIAAVILMAYNAAAFQSPFHLGYASEEGFEQLHKGLFGISTPEWWRLREILIGRYRGLLPISPLMALTPIGLALVAARPAGAGHYRRSGRYHRGGWKRRVAVIVAAAIGAFYLLLNASYFYWEGGWIFGPRHVSPALPFLAIGLAPLWDSGRAAFRAALAAGWIWGVALTLIAVSTTPQPPASIEQPISELMLPAFRVGDLALNTQRFTDFRIDELDIRRHTGNKAAWNLGMKMGLNGLVSLVPLGIVWLGCGLWLIAAAGRTTSARAAPGSV